MSEQDLADLLMYCGDQSAKVIQTLDQFWWSSTLLLIISACACTTACIAMSLALHNYRTIVKQHKDKQELAFQDHRTGFFNSIRELNKEEAERTI